MYLHGFSGSGRGGGALFLLQAGWGGRAPGALLLLPPMRSDGGLRIEKYWCVRGKGRD